MTAFRMHLGLFLVAVGLLGCGGNLNTNGAPDGSTPTVPCYTMGACACMAASDRCESLTEACWCASECNPNIACVCGGGKFIECHDRTPETACDNQASRVTSMCAGTPFVNEIPWLCTSGASPACMGQCLSALTTTESCAQIDCSFCLAGCDCTLPSMPSALRNCVVSCWAAGNP
jgi:hypothetical protein